MTRRITKKMMSFDGSKKDFAEISNELEKGWYIVNIKPYGEAFLCVLEKNMDNHDNNTIQNLKLQDILATYTSKKKFNS
ncbi:hypothetical protein NOVO_03560 [Rickettsiales bacterium Ac37b]|nr:hypothetical protein NOVO_03560 [Rickettsiales bacterium Ac37b]